MEASLAPDMELVMAMKEHGLKVDDLIHYIAYETPWVDLPCRDTKIKAMEAFLTWYINNK